MISLNEEIKRLPSLLVIHLPVTCLISVRKRESFTQKDGSDLISSSQAWFHQHPAKNLKLIFITYLFSMLTVCVYHDPASLISLLSHFHSAVKIYRFVTDQTGGHILKIDVYLFSGGEKCQIIGSAVDRSYIVYICFMTHIFNLLIKIGFIGWPCVLLLYTPLRHRGSFPVCCAYTCMHAYLYILLFVCVSAHIVFE